MRSPKHKLTRTSDGWVKKINRKTTWICSDSIAPTPELADDYYERNMTTLWQPPVPTAADQLTVADLGDHFLDRKRRSKIEPRTFDEYAKAVQDFSDMVGADLRLSDLTPLDFAKARVAWAKRFGPDRLKKFVGTIRSMFAWARKPPFRLPEPDYGDEFNPPRKVEFRLDRKRHRETHGSRDFTPVEIGRLLGCAAPSPRAMILLALNAGLGNMDVAKLPLSVVDLDDGWVDYARGKTGIDRRFPLWPETIAAIRRVLKLKRYRRGHAAGLLFVTRQGRCYIEDRESKKSGKLLHKDRVSAEFRRVCINANVPQNRRGFYSLRRTFRTIADEHGDQRAAALVMGHEVADMGSVYVQRVSDARLKDLTDHVHSVLADALRCAPRKATSKRRKRGAAKRKPAKRDRREESH